MLIAYIIKPVNTNIEDNIVILITMMSATISLLSLFMDYMEMKSLYGKTLINITKNIDRGLYIGIKNIKEKIKNKKDK